MNENTFKHHPPTGNKAEKHEQVRKSCMLTAILFEAYCPTSRELSLAMTKIEEAMMWANAAIARNPEKDGVELGLHPYAARRMTPEEVPHA